MDKGSKFIKKGVTTNASVHDSKPVKELVDENDRREDPFTECPAVWSALREMNTRKFLFPILLLSTRMEERCLVMGTLDESLQFTPKVIRKPGDKVPFSYGEFFEQLLEVTEDAIYYINYRGNDNHIEEIR